MDNLAKFLIEKNNLTILRKFQILASHRSWGGNAHSAGVMNSLSCDNCQPIGTWYPQNKEGTISFVRQNVDDWMFWEVSRNSITKEKASDVRARICLIGESAAAGMFYTPHFSPSKALENQLSSISEDKYDVIDLTRNSIGAQMLNATFVSSFQLKPDYIVIFAGNNWFSEAQFRNDLDFVGRHDYMGAIEDANLSNIADVYQKNLKNKVKTILADLKAIAERSQAKVIFLIPASNYLEWNHKAPIPWLGESGLTSRWHTLYRAACDLLNKKNFNQSMQIGLEMFSLDGGKQVVSNRIIAISLIELQRYDEAYRYCVNVIDYCNTYNEVTSQPNMPSFLKKLVIDELDSCDINILNLEEIFTESLETKIFDGRLFIDYCHMTPHGFNVAMAPVVEIILHHMDGDNLNDVKRRKYNWKSILKNSTVPIDKNKLNFAISNFYIGLYLIHMNHPITDTYNVEKSMRLFREAVELSDEVLDIMQDYIKAKSCDFGNGFLLSKAGQRIFDASNSPLDIPVARFAQGVDPYVVSSLCTVLDEKNRNGSELLSSYVKHYARLLDGGVDISEPLYIEGITAVIRLKVDSEINTRRNLPYFKSRWEKSYFTLVIDDNASLKAAIICRQKNITSGNFYVAIEVNGYQIETIIITEHWKKSEFLIDRKYLHVGFNRVAVHWPRLTGNERTAAEVVARNYFTAIDVDIFPVFGEIFSFYVNK